MVLLASFWSPLSYSTVTEKNILVVSYYVYILLYIPYAMISTLYLHGVCTVLVWVSPHTPLSMLVGLLAPVLEGVSKHGRWAP